MALVQPHRAGLVAPASRCGGGPSRAELLEPGIDGAGQEAKKRLEIGKEVRDGEMPLWFYTPLHPHAKLTDADKQLLERWSQGGAEPNAKAD